VVHRAWSNTGRRMNSALAWFLTFHFAVVTHVIFRASSFGEALNVFRGMVGLNGVMLPDAFKGLAPLKAAGVKFGPWLTHIGEKQTYIFYIMLGAAAIAFFAKNSSEMAERMKPTAKWALFAALLLGAGIIHITQISEFIYFNF
jgi:alginate O-acetyltransferase complex protein AlgI